MKGLLTALGGSRFPGKERVAIAYEEGIRSARRRLVPPKKPPHPPSAAPDGLRLPCPGLGSRGAAFPIYDPR